jgi:hypothetical protein
MDLKEYVSIEVKKGDLTFVFYMPKAATWGTAWDASFEVMQYMNQQLKQLSEPQIQPAEPVQTPTDTAGA